jgi:hypothetical protein
MTELAAPPAVLLRQHLIVHGLSTSSRRPANSDYYRVPTGVPAMVNIARPNISMALPRVAPGVSSIFHRSAQSIPHTYGGEFAAFFSFGLAWIVASWDLLKETKLVSSPVITVGRTLGVRY